jgi:hypothetical protein
LRTRIISAALVSLVATTGYAQERADSAAFVIRLGNDTTAIERVIRSRTQLLAEAVQRSPTTSVHRMVMDLAAGGEVRRSVYTVLRPGTSEPFFTRTMTFEGDSATVVSAPQGGTQRTSRVAARGAIPIAGPFYSAYEMAMMRTVSARRQRDSVPLLPLDAVVRIPIERVGADSIVLTNQFDEPMRARIDARGRLLRLHTPMFTTVERVGWLDLDAWVREFAARDASGRAMGPLSPRQASRSYVGGANLWIDYSRPSMRGRPVWGALVPFGRVWRMGANDAAHFSTDRRVRLGSLTLDPGTYSLFLLPSADAWTLVVNRKTGMSGLEYDATADVGRMALTRQPRQTPAEQFTLELRPTETGANLYLAWDREGASVPIDVLP